MPFQRIRALALVLAVLACQPLRADEKLKGIACRSVHLGYPAPEGTAFYNEIKVEKSADGTYFMVCGWSKGYYGIQEQANGKKLLIFSVWDPGNQNDPKSVKEDQRVKLLHQDKDVRIGRFGNEGTGGQSFFDYEWKVGATYRFLVTAAPDGESRTAYTGWFFHPEKKEWKKLVTFSTITKGTLLSGYYSFIEDFRRNKISATREREALFGNGWVYTKEKKWNALEKARFTGDANPVTNINAKVSGEQFYLGTGGAIENKDANLRETITRPAKKNPPADVVELLKSS
jgi:Domain of unknown function (DUF3472)